MGTIGDIRTRFEMAMNEAKQPSKKSIQSFWLEGFKGFMKSKDFAGVSSRKGDTGEVLRASFGSNDGNAESKITEFLKEVGGLDKKSYEIESMGIGPVSSEYFAYKIILKKPSVDKLGKTYKKGDFFVITNRYKVGKDGEHSVIGRKDLTPDNLKITKAEYKSAAALISVIKPAIEARGYPENYTNFILKSTKELFDNTTNKGKFTTFEKYSTAPIQSIEYPISKDLFEGIDQLSINNFQNDYGEILGGFALFNLLSDVNTGMSFPKSSNEKLVDFYFDGYSVSSKAGGGGTPTGDTIIRKIHALNKQTIVLPEGTSEMDFFSNVIEPWVDAPKLSGSGTYDNIMNLSSINIKDQANSGYWYLSQQTGLGPKQLDQKSVVAYLDELYKDEVKFKEFLTELWNKAGMKWDKKMLDAYTAGYPKMGRNQIGIVFYAIHVEIANKLNDLYSKELTKFSQMATDVKQLYLDVLVKKNIFKFKAVPFKTASFKFSQKGSIPNPFNSNMGIKIQK
tara:strand:+ start:70 stop:1596 length:1527 start_codon:yes stop_codon:yes gene_type:complete